MSPAAYRKRSGKPASAATARSIVPLLVGLAVLAPAPVTGQTTPTAAARAPDTVAIDLLIYVGSGCPHCARALVWVEDLLKRHPELTVVTHDVVQDAEALEALGRLARVG